ncbi:glycosyl hydrolase family 8 [Aquimarina agarilytica]|uniref:glycosyl hydrolase family 8 n=1 Tax=Aquimarina agarilytica TaxID=1087449 RepID=UPI00028958D4|nr:glycosyl hydrolase family 8 [Aquimarina agarilytica]
MNKLYTCFFVFFLALVSFSQPPTSPEVFVDINSGNPAFPFPQFLAYESANHKLGNLATNNAPGITHAEMEQATKDAWQIMANRFKYTGESHAGVKYIIGNLGCPHDCTEGDGYAMLGAAEMADKTTFDGLWFRVHDLKMIKQPRYKDCVVPDKNYQWGDLSISEKGLPGSDSAADGDVDIALALLVAYKQWGGDSGHKDGCGNVINYKEEALKVIRGLVERFEGNVKGNEDFTSGIIGFDGYQKGGNTWLELSKWSATLINPKPQYGPNTPHHIDYNAPAYFHAFQKFLEDNGDTRDQGWNIDQFKRAEASSDWLMGKMLDNPATLPLAGWVDLDAANNPIYSSFSEGEDFRNPWRTILNYVWHGDPKTSWNPSIHEVEAGGNSFEKNIGKRLATFMKNPGQAPWSNDCWVATGGPSLSYNGVSQLRQQYDPNSGKIIGAFPLNWLAGTGSPAAIAAEDYDLMGKLYRQCVIEWDTTTAGDGYLTSIPGYFHGFFRLLGMLTLSGNHHSPAETILESNLKVYHSVDKTFAFTGDEVEFTVAYRNYASVDGKDVKISTLIPKGMSFVSATNGGVNAGGTVTWDIGTVPGFKTATGISPTTGEVKMILKIDKGTTGRICTEFDIETSNGKGWTSNEFPNEETAVMQRNCFDVAEKALEIEKTVDNATVNPGDQVTYTVDFENASSGGFLNGGRQDVIPAYAHSGHGGTTNQRDVKIRLYHGAAEPYIDYGNYRISLFLNDNAVDCVAGTPGCTGTGWALDAQIYEGGDRSKVSITSEKIIPGSDAKGAWNQRVIVKFSEQLATITPHISRYFGLTGGRVHQGGANPLRAKWQMHTSAWGNVQWDDDWSWNPAVSDGDDGLYYPVTNNWTDPDNPDVPVTEYHNEACEKPTITIDNVLVEEWDGFTWRRIFGNSPVPGREVEDVVLTDVLPVGFTFVGFVDATGKNLGDTVEILGEKATYDKATRTITWKKSAMQVKEKGAFSYLATANFSSGTCPRADEIQINTASIEAKNESPVIDTAEVTITCTPVILPPPPSSMTKTVLPKSAVVGDQVTYTLSYKNTDGSPFEADFTRSWTTQSGPAMTVTPNVGVSNVSNSVAVSTHDFSHGTNGTIEAEVNFADSQAYGFALRHTGGAIDNGIYIVFKPNFGGGNIETEVFDGTRPIKATGITPSGNPAKIKLQLVDDQLQVWMGNTTTPTPTWTVTGLPIRAGYAGVINGYPNSASDNSGIHQLIAYKSSLDSAFDLQITDPIPAEINFVSAADSGVNTAGVVTYPIISGPVLADTEVTYSWKGEIASCPSATSKIINLAYTNALGLPKDFVSAQAILDCSGADLCALVDVDEPTQNVPVFCVGEIANDIDTYITATETIVWYVDKVSTSAISKPIIDTAVASNTTYYVAQKTADDCESDRVEVVVEVKTGAASQSATKTIQSGVAVDFDIETEMGLEPGSISWETIDNTNVMGESIASVTSDVITDVLVNTSSLSETITYTITSVPTTGCAPEPSELVVTVLPPVTTLSAFITGDSVTEGEDLEFVVKLTEIAATDVEVTIAVSDISTLPADYNITNTSITVLAGSDEAIFVIPTIDDTEVELLETLEVAIVNVNAMPNSIVSTANGEIEDNDMACPVIDKPVVATIELCVGEPITDIETYVTATETIVWYADALSTTPISKPIIDTSVATTVFYYVAQITPANCESDRVQVGIRIKEGDVGQFKTKTIINGATVNYDIVAEMGLEAGSISIVATSNDNVTGETVVNLNSDVVADGLTNNSTVPQVVTYTITANPSAGCAPEPSTLEVTVLPTATVLTAIINSGATVVEGGNLIFPITLTEVATKDIEVTFEVRDVTTVFPEDYSKVTLSALILAGSNDTVFILETIDDLIEENTETLELRIVNVDGMPNPIEQTAIGTIEDNDGPVPCTMVLPPLVNNASFCFGDVPLAIETFISVTETLVWYGDATTASKITKPIINTGVASDTTYYVSQKDASDCESERVSFTISVAPEKVPQFDTITIESGKSVDYDLIFNMGVLENSFSWQASSEVAFIEGENTFNSQSRIISDVLVNTTDQVQEVVYEIMETGGDCPASSNSSLIVRVNPPKDRGYPLFFTPNGDTQHDYWEVSTKTIALIEYIEIYDRYGKLLVSIKPTDRWNGTYNDLHMPADDYWFVATLKDGQQETGHFSLIR